MADLVLARILGVRHCGHIGEPSDDLYYFAQYLLEYPTVPVTEYESDGVTVLEHPVPTIIATCQAECIDAGCNLAQAYYTLAYRPEQPLEPVLTRVCLQSEQPRH